MGIREQLDHRDGVYIAAGSRSADARSSLATAAGCQRNQRAARLIISILSSAGHAKHSPGTVDVAFSVDPSTVCLAPGQLLDQPAEPAARPNQIDRRQIR